MADKKPSNYQDVMDEKLRAKEASAPTTKTEMGKPLVPMIRSGDKLVPQFLKDADPGEPIPARGYRNRGRGLEAVPDDSKYKKGGKVKASSAYKRADGIAKRGRTNCKMV